MSDPTDAPAGAGATALDRTPAEYTPQDLGNMFAEARSTEIPAERADPERDVTAAPELAQANAAPEKVPGEVTAEADPAEVPPIEPPRSWTKDRKEQFNALPRDLQEYVADRVQEQDREFRTRQNEAAEQGRALKAQLEAAERARQQYEAQLPSVMQALQDAQNGSFADIRTVDDVQKLANEDPFRYLQWQAHQTKLQAVNAELERSKGEQSRAEQSEWMSHVQKENELAVEYIPELATQEKKDAFYKRAITRLTELGFKSEEVNDLATGKQKLSIHDHRLQQLLWSDFKFADIQKAKIAATAKPVPPVPQRPGPAKPPGSAQSETITKLSDKLERTGETRDLGALIGALRRA